MLLTPYFHCLKVLVSQRALISSLTRRAAVFFPPQSLVCRCFNVGPPFLFSYPPVYRELPSCASVRIPPWRANFASFQVFTENSFYSPAQPERPCLKEITYSFRTLLGSVCLAPPPPRPLQHCAILFNCLRRTCFLPSKKVFSLF